VAMAYAGVCVATALLWPDAKSSSGGGQAVEVTLGLAQGVVGFILLGGWVVPLAIIYVLALPVGHLIDPCLAVGYGVGFRCTDSFASLVAAFVVPVATLTLYAGRLLDSLTILESRTKRVWVLVLFGSGLALLGALFLPWYSGFDDSGASTASAWAAFEGLEVFLAAAAAVAMIAAIVRILRSDRTARLVCAVAASSAALASGLCFYRLFTSADGDSTLSDPSGGAFLGLSAAIIITATAYLLANAETTVTDRLGKRPAQG